MHLNQPDWWYENQRLPNRFITLLLLLEVVAAVSEATPEWMSRSCSNKCANDPVGDGARGISAMRCNGWLS